MQKLIIVSSVFDDENNFNRYIVDILPASMQKKLLYLTDKFDNLDQNLIIEKVSIFMLKSALSDITLL